MNLVEFSKSVGVVSKLTSFEGSDAVAKGLPRHLQDTLKSRNVWAKKSGKSVDDYMRTRSEAHRLGRAISRDLAKLKAAGTKSGNKPGVAIITRGTTRYKTPSGDSYLLPTRGIKGQRIAAGYYRDDSRATLESQHDFSRWLRSKNAARRKAGE